MLTIVLITLLHGERKYGLCKVMIIISNTRKEARILNILLFYKKMLIIVVYYFVCFAEIFVSSGNEESFS